MVSKKIVNPYAKKPVASRNVPTFKTTAIGSKYAPIKLLDGEPSPPKSNPVRNVKEEFFLPSDGGMSSSSGEEEDNNLLTGCRLEPRQVSFEDPPTLGQTFPDTPSSSPSSDLPEGPHPAL